MESTRLSREMRRLQFSEAGCKAAVKENINDTSDNGAESEDEISELREKIGDYTVVAEEGYIQREKWWMQEAVQEVLDKCGNKFITKRKASDMLGVPYNYVSQRMNKIEKENEKKAKKFKSGDEKDLLACEEISLIHTTTTSATTTSATTTSGTTTKPLTDEEAAQLLCMSLYNFRSRNTWQYMTIKDPATKILIMSQIGEYKEIKKSGKEEDINIWWSQPMVRKIIELYRRKIIINEIAEELLGVPLTENANENFQNNIPNDIEEEPEVNDHLVQKNHKNNSTSSTLHDTTTKNKAVILTCENNVTLKNQENVIHRDQQMNGKMPQSASKTISETNEKEANEEETSDDDSRDDAQLWEVEEILSHRKHKSRIEYLVKWEGYGKEEATWEPKENLVTCLQMVNDYHIKLHSSGHRNSTEVESASIESPNTEKITKILNDRIRDGISEYLVQWKKSGRKFAPSWEPMSSISGFKESLKEYIFLKTNDRIQDQIRKEIDYYSKKRLSNGTSSVYCFTSWLVKNNEGDYTCKYCSEKSYPLGPHFTSINKGFRNKLQTNGIYLLQYHAIDYKHLEHVKRKDISEGKNNFDLTELNKSYSDKETIPSNTEILSALNNVQIDNLDITERTVNINEEMANEKTPNENQMLDKISGFMLCVAKFQEYLPRLNPTNSFQFSQFRAIELREWEKASQEKKQTFHDFAHDINLMIQQLKKDKVQNNNLLTGYVLFSAEKRRELLLKNPQVNGVRLSVLAFNDWKRLTWKKQTEYQEKALQINLINLEFVLQAHGLIKPHGKNSVNTDICQPSDANQSAAFQKLDGKENEGLLAKALSDNSFSSVSSPCIKSFSKYKLKVETVLAHEGGCETPGSYLVRFCRVGREVKHGWIKTEKMIADPHTRDLLSQYWKKKALEKNAASSDVISTDGIPNFTSQTDGNEKKDFHENSFKKNLQIDTPKAKRSPSVLVENANDGVQVPEGWQRIVRMRTGGLSIGKCDVTYMSPTGKRLRSKIEVEQYCLENGLDKLSGITFLHRISADEYMTFLTEQSQDSPLKADASPKIHPVNSSNNIRRDSFSNNICSENTGSSPRIFKTLSKEILKVETILAHEGGSETPGSYLVRFCQIGQEAKHGWIKAAKMTVDEHSRVLLSQYWEKMKVKETSEGTTPSSKDSSGSSENG